MVVEHMFPTRGGPDHARHRLVAELAHVKLPGEEHVLLQVAKVGVLRNLPEKINKGKIGDGS